MSIGFHRTWSLRQNRSKSQWGPVWNQSLLPRSKTSKRSTGERQCSTENPTRQTTPVLPSSPSTITTFLNPCPQCSVPGVVNQGQHKQAAAMPRAQPKGRYQLTQVRPPYTSDVFSAPSSSSPSPSTAKSRYSPNTTLATKSVSTVMPVSTLMSKASSPSSPSTQMVG